MLISIARPLGSSDCGIKWFVHALETGKPHDKWRRPFKKLYLDGLGLRANRL